MTDATWALRKATLCKFYLSAGGCKRGTICGYAHTLDQIERAPQRLWRNATAALGPAQVELIEAYALREAEGVLEGFAESAAEPVIEESFPHAADFYITPSSPTHIGPKEETGGEVVVVQEYPPRVAPGGAETNHGEAEADLRAARP